MLAAALQIDPEPERLLDADSQIVDLYSILICESSAIPF